MFSTTTRHTTQVIVSRLFQWWRITCPMHRKKPKLHHWLSLTMSRWLSLTSRRRLKIRVEKIKQKLWHFTFSHCWRESSHVPIGKWLVMLLNPLGVNDQIHTDSVPFFLSNFFFKREKYKVRKFELANDQRIKCWSRNMFNNNFSRVKLHVRPFCTAAEFCQA